MPDSQMRHIPKETLSVLEHFEEMRLKAPVEHGIVVNALGEILLDKTGTVTGLTFTRKQMELMDGTWFSHNHPEGNSFSPSDIRLMMMTGLKRIRVVGCNELYQCLRHQAEPTDHLLRHTPAEVENWLKNRAATLEEIQNRLIYKRRLNRYKARVDFWHQVNLEGARQFGYSYTRTRIHEKKTA